jgi:hypothetical protein
MQKTLIHFLFISIILLIFSMVFYLFYIEEPSDVYSYRAMTLIGLLVLVIVFEYLDQLSIKSIKYNNSKIDEKNKIIEHQFENNKLLTKLLESYKSKIELAKTIRPIAELNLATVILSEPIKIEEDNFLIHPKLKNEEQFKSLKSYILSKFVLENNYSDKHLVENVEIDIPNNTIDPIGNMNPVFDGYIESETEELFISIGFLGFISSCFYERLYVQLARLHWYQQCKQKQIMYKVIFVSFSNNQNVQKEAVIDTKYYSSFLPSIKSGLLYFEHTSVLEQEILQVISPIFNT